MVDQAASGLCGSSPYEVGDHGALRGEIHPGTNQPLAPASITLTLTRWTRPHWVLRHGNTYLDSSHHNDAAVGSCTGLARKLLGR